MEKMTVLIVPPGKCAYEAEIEHSLRAEQAVVGGCIETCRYYDDPILLVCNDEGKINGLPLSRAIYDETGKMIEIIAGTFFICGVSNGDFCDLTPNLIRKYKELFQWPHVFFKLYGGDIFAEEVSLEDYKTLMNHN